MLEPKRLEPKSEVFSRDKPLFKVFSFFLSLFLGAVSSKCAAHGILTSFSCLTVILVLAQDGWATLGMLEGIERQASLFLAKDRRAAYRIPK